MSRKNLGQQGLASLRARFQNLAPREQKLVLIMLAVIGAALLWACFTWQLKENARLDKALPQARAQLARMQDAAAEITRLRVKGKPAQSTGKVLLESLQAAAQVHGLALEVQGAENGLVRISGKALYFDAWVAWLGQIQREQGLLPVYADIALEPQGLRIEAQLSASGT